MIQIEEWYWNSIGNAETLEERINKQLTKNQNYKLICVTFKPITQLSPEPKVMVVFEEINK